MKQSYSYKVFQIGPKDSTVLTDSDRKLVNSYFLGIQSFNPDDSRLDVIVSDPNENVLETYIDSPDYTVRGVVQGTEKINQIEVDPTLYFADRTYLDDQIIVEYRAFTNLYGKGAELYIAEISTDRTEIRLKSISISPRDIQYYTTKLQSNLNNQSYFSEVYLEIDNFGQFTVINALPEVTDSGIVATLKLYEPLPFEVEEKSICRILESLGESSRFSVTQEVVVTEDPIPELKGPNFAVEVGSSTIVTDYRNYLDLLSQKSWETSKGLYTAFKQSALHTSVDYNDFSDFVHFSSAAERLENARFKFELIFNLQVKQQTFLEADRVSDAEKVEKEIEGIIDNFDHYENYLYFEYGENAWPKKVDEETGLVIRPYELETNPLNYEKWYELLFRKAESYDLNNKDLLTNTIPVLIREDLDHNEPYLLFIDMIGQHFDDLWVYARAITDRYNADNRAEFGISKELVKDALESFGINLYESNQNLNAFFELCQPDGTYDKGLETYVNKFRAARAPYNWVGSEDSGSWQLGDEYALQEGVNQPMLADAYTKEVYKRIYHNIPTLLKTKGTSRGLRVLLNCFGIPNDILKFRVQGGVDTRKRPFFGPEESIQISPTFESEFECKIEQQVQISGSRDKIRVVPTEQITEYRVDEKGTGSFFTQSVLSRYVPTTASHQYLTDDLHKVEVGFDLNEAVNHLFSQSLFDLDENFTVDDVIGDPRNKLEQYGDPWKHLRTKLIQLKESRDEEGNREWIPLEEGEQYRTPAAIIRLVRYFDTTFFRMLQDFIPARASIDSGVIVKDNFLHRNRWKGVKASWQVIIESGSITGSQVYGSHGGSFRYAGHKMDTGDLETVTTGDKWILKKVPSGSREINGQLTGSNLQVTDGELTRDNDLRKARQPRNRYNINVWFLDLPDIPLCNSKVTASFLTNYWEFKASGSKTLAVFTGGEEAVQLNSTASKVFSPDIPFTSSVQTHWTESNMLPKKTNATFLGWFSGSVTVGKPYTPYHLVDVSNFVEGTKYKWTAAYSTKSRNVLWFMTIRPSGSYYDGQYSYQYYPTDLMVSWKYLPASEDPTEARMSSSSSVWNVIGKPTIVLSSGSLHASVTMPEKEIFGTEGGYFWVGFESASVDQFDGVESIGNNTGPFFNGGKIVDAQWAKAKGDWPYKEWEVITGSIGSRDDNWFEV